MDVEGARKFRLSKQSLVLIIPLVTLLVMSVFWNARQSRLIAEERARVIAAQREETARAKEVADRAEARKNRNAKWAASDARVQQLYRELDTLSRINEQVIARPQQKRSTPNNIDNPAATISFP
jgi:hypothetical protein